MNERVNALYQAINALTLGDIRDAGLVDSIRSLQTMQDILQKQGCKTDPNTPDGLTAEEWAEATGKSKINAIKAVRFRCGIGLVDAKKVVEQHLFNAGLPRGYNTGMSLSELARLGPEYFPVKP